MAEQSHLLHLKGIGNFPVGLEMSVRTTWDTSITGQLLAATGEFFTLKDLQGRAHVVRYEGILYLSFAGVKAEKQNAKSVEELHSDKRDVVQEEANS